MFVAELYTKGLLQEEQDKLSTQDKQLEMQRLQVLFTER